MSLTRILHTVNLKVNEARSLLLPWFDHDESFLNFRPTNGGWSGLQILEHVMLTSHYLLVLIDKGSIKAMKRAQTVTLNMDWSNYVLNTNALEEIGIHKSFNWIRPTHMEPSGNVSTDEIKNKIQEKRNEMILRTLYRPTGANELKLIIDSGMKYFPPRLFWQPIFYPVLNFQYAAEIAERWNMGDPDSDGVGFVTAFEISEAYFKIFQVQTVGLDHHQELWVPAEQLIEFNDNIINGIRVEKAFIGSKFNLSDEIKDVLPVNI